MVVGIETDRGLWVAALIAAGYRVYAINPLQVSRYRERHSISGAKSDRADAHTLADMVRTDARQLRPVATDSPKIEAIKVVARAHKTLIWEHTRHTQPLRHHLREYFPAVLEAFEDLSAPRTRCRTSRRAAPAGQQARGHPARLPGPSDPLRRNHRLVTPRCSRDSNRRCLTFKRMGCLSSGRS